MPATDRAGCKSVDLKPSCIDASRIVAALSFRDFRVFRGYSCRSGSAAVGEIAAAAACVDWRMTTTTGRPAAPQADRLATPLLPQHPMNTAAFTEALRLGRALMSIGFAGSRGMDDRRRRRLAQAAETAERRPPVRPPVPAAPTRFAASPIESVVRPQLWVNLLLAVLALTVCGGAIYLGEWIGRNQPAANSSFGSRGLLLRTIDACLFLFGAQLAAAIHWYRARSRKDFNARYRIWHFVVPSLLAFGFCAATDAHLVVAEWAQSRWRVAGDHAPALIWMVPAGIVLLAMVRLLQTEMRGTIAAAPSLWMAILAAVANAAVILRAPVPIDDATLAIVGRCSMLLWPLGLMLSLLFYARSVIYVTNEPSALPSPPVAAEDAGRRWLTWWRPRRKAERETTAEAKAAMTRSKPAAEATESETDLNSAKAARPETKPAAAPIAKPTPPAVTAPAEPELEEEEPVSKTTFRADRAHDDEDDDDHRHRHMSKKDRKKLRRMQQREEREMYE